VKNLVKQQIWLQLLELYKKDGFSQNKDGSTLVTWCVGHLLELANPEAYDENYKK
jgi:hypothetical protein